MRFLLIASLHLKLLHLQLKIRIARLKGTQLRIRLAKLHAKIDVVTLKNGELICRKSQPFLQDLCGTVLIDELLDSSDGVEAHLISSANVKEHATLSAGASVDHGVEVKTREDHVNRAADRGCCVSTCCASLIHAAESTMYRRPSTHVNRHRRDSFRK